MKVLAIIPCYNEEDSIVDTISNLTSMAPEIDYVIINDGSTDNTAKVCEKQKFNVLNLPFNLGLSNAVQTGMRYALRLDYDCAVQFDGDGQHLPEYIAGMVKFMNEKQADIVIGSRYIQKSVRGLRGIGQILLRCAIRIVAGKTITDPTSGMRLFNREMIKRFATQMNYGPEPDTLVYLMKRCGAKVLEMPVTMQERKAGKSYFSGLTAARYMIHMIISIVLIQWFRVEVATK